MSGGHWDYSGYEIQRILERIGKDEEVSRRFPILSSVFVELADVLCNIEHELDYDLSDDTKLEDDAGFQAQAISKLLLAVNVGNSGEEILSRVRILRRNAEEVVEMCNNMINGHESAVLDRWAESIDLPQ